MEERNRKIGIKIRDRLLKYFNNLVIWVAESQMVGDVAGKLDERHTHP